MTKINYFKDCTTIDQAKNLFRKLCIKLHPDHNQSETAHEDFIELKKQYDSFKPSEGRKRNTADQSDNLFEIVSKFNNLENVVVSFIGSWIWLEDETEGATLQQLEKIRQIEIDGYKRKWNKVRKLWQFIPIQSKYRKFKSDHKSIEELKNFFGSKEYKTEGAYKLNFA